MAETGDVTMSVSGMTTKMSDGTWSITINSNGRVSSLQRKGTEFLASNGIYFDYTTSEGNKGLSPSKVTVVKNTAEHCACKDNQFRWYGYTGILYHMAS